MVGGSVLIERTVGVFIGGLVKNIHKKSTFGDLNGVEIRDWEWLSNAGDIPLYSNGNCDGRGWHLIVNHII